MRTLAIGFSFLYGGQYRLILLCMRVQTISAIADFPNLEVNVPNLRVNSS